MRGPRPSLVVIVSKLRDWKSDKTPKVTKLVSAQRRLTLLSERDDPDFSTDMLQVQTCVPVL